jgi:uncharacterized protein (DUF2336 family)
VLLVPDELAAKEPLCFEVDRGVELAAICELANEFLSTTPPPERDAAFCDKALATLLRNTSEHLQIEVAKRLAHVDYGLPRTIRLLAYSATPAVAVPVLQRSSLLPSSEIAAIARARTRPQLYEEHLIAIAGREKLDAQVTDVLTDRGSRRIFEALAANPTARFSYTGLRRLAIQAYREALRRRPKRPVVEWIL